MDRAPLTEANARARAAFNLQASPKSSLSAAEQHQAAAGEFHKAANGVDDLEALRILNLLEKHHERLARIVKEQVSVVRSSGKSPNTSSNEGDNAGEGEATGRTQDAKHKQSTSTRVESQIRAGRRDASSSIAVDLATARGIPASQRRPRQASTPVHGLTDRHTSHKGSKAPPEATVSSANARLHDTAKTVDSEKTTDVVDGTQSSYTDPFNRFYSTFGGLLSKLSAPLAYAGLPLTPNDTPQTSSETPERGKVSAQYASASDQPDLNDLFSKAALRALRDEHASLGAVQESFYVVPTGGGTVSYANILARTDRHNRRVSADTTIHERPEEEENFVDASESPHATSPRVVRTAGVPPKSSAGSKTVEELEMENDSLKQLTDNLSRRLYMWEKSAQNQTSALQQSIRNLRSSQAMPSSVIPPTVDPNDKTKTDAKVVKELEAKIQSMQKDLERYEKDNETLKTLVGRYRERWEKLKEGARTRRDGTSDQKSTETQPVVEET